MKTIKISLLVLCTLISTTGMTQKSNKANHRLVKADSILTLKLELTETEQVQFLPMYHEYVNAKKENRKKFLISERKGKKKIEDLSDEELDAIIQQRFAFKQADLELKKKYHEKFKTVLPMKKLAKFYHIEKRIYSRGKGMYDSKKRKGKPRN